VAVDEIVAKAKARPTEAARVNKVALAMGSSWLAVQNPHDILSGGEDT
jgi:hypothetical protein